jgi:hypothetical protein
MPSEAADDDRRMIDGTEKLGAGADGAGGSVVAMASSAAVGGVMVASCVAVVSGMRLSDAALPAAVLAVSEGSCCRVRSAIPSSIWGWRDCGTRREKDVSKILEERRKVHRQRWRVRVAKMLDSDFGEEKNWPFPNSERDEIWVRWDCGSD